MTEMPRGNIKIFNIGKNMKNEQNNKSKKEYCTPVIEIIEMMGSADLLEGSPCVFPQCMDVKTDN